MTACKHFGAVLTAAVMACSIRPGQAAARPPHGPQRPKAHHASHPKTSRQPKTSHHPLAAAARPAPAATETAPAPALPAIGGTLQILETVFDGGRVDRGSNVEHVFTLKNVGTADLTVDARPGCGCTVVDFDKVIAPGATGRLSASVDTVDFRGAITKTIALTTSDPQHHATVLQIKALVIVPVDVLPNEAVFIDGRAGALVAKTVTVVSTDGATFDVISAASTDPAFSLAVAPTATPAAPGKRPAKAAAPAAPAAPAAGTLASGSKSYDVTVNVAKDVAIGHPSATITLKTSHPKAAEVPIRVFANVTGDVVLEPERLILLLDAGEPETSRTQHVTITEQAEGRALAVTGVESQSPRIKTTLTTVTPGKAYDLEVAYEGPLTQAPLDTEVIIRTDDPRQGSIVLPVFLRSEALAGEDPGPQATATAPMGPASVSPTPEAGQQRSSPAATAGTRSTARTERARRHRPR